ncbi:GrpE -like protein 1, mitochondrial [Trichinella pseudospiralis]|uniref:GrpE-like protein 1, mitochondrial n=1 Tax=Trichinella pseudospiralis TaxID=6337 RepID=A0A0V1F082_TRIPS|nr:GrpE -like protein 1, mitochondrial [Trichinella pseudospiralis]KRY79358.1 GrpE -like protein 1, mitochondrial [Trichinella pseudospiralis]KRZ32396.1 GrpE -like protein 1, mitochondrial [Trichinella pseudospiralis]KRZ45798.1 GrpE -like protein 1, mitochondrial [Trichinella pseudospiralis]
MSCSRLMTVCNVFQKVVRYGSNFCPSCTKKPFLSAPVYSKRTAKYYSAQSHEESTIEDKSKKDGDGPQTCNADSDKEATVASAALSDKNVQLEKEIKQLEDKYKRSLAENENLRARMVRQLEEVKLFSLQAFCKDLLEIADILRLAADSVSEEALKNSQRELKNLHDGVLLTNTQLLKIFQKYGVTPVNPINEKFNPNFHEAVFEVPDPEKEPGTVAVVQKIGYMLHQRCLRAAQVGVVKAQL